MESDDDTIEFEIEIVESSSSNSSGAASPIIKTEQPKLDNPVEVVSNEIVIEVESAEFLQEPEVGALEQVKQVHEPDQQLLDQHQSLLLSIEEVCEELDAVVAAAAAAVEESVSDKLDATATVEVEVEVAVDNQPLDDDDDADKLVIECQHSSPEKANDKQEVDLNDNSVAEVEQVSSEPVCCSDQKREANEVEEPLTSSSHIEVCQAIPLGSPSERPGEVTRDDLTLSAAPEPPTDLPEGSELNEFEEVDSALPPKPPRSELPQIELEIKPIEVAEPIEVSLTSAAENQPPELTAPDKLNQLVNVEPETKKVSDLEDKPETTIQLQETLSTPTPEPELEQKPEAEAEPDHECILEVNQKADCEFVVTDSQLIIDTCSADLAQQVATQASEELLKVDLAPIAQPQPSKNESEPEAEPAASIYSNQQQHEPLISDKQVNISISGEAEMRMAPEEEAVVKGKRRQSLASYAEDEDLEWEFDNEPTFERRQVEVKRDGNVRAHYELGDELGRGKFGRVYRCVELATGRKLAAKFVHMRRREDREDVEREVSIMSQLQHPRLLQLYDAFDEVTCNEMCLVTELVEGGELFERIVDDDFELTEKKAAVFMRQICQGVEYMHSQGIVHLDMKPENILCVSKTGNRIKLIDFGLARHLTPEEPLRVMFGTPDFAAPEVLAYDFVSLATDMWSVGVICYVLLSGLSPFMGDNDMETMANVTRATYDFDDAAFDPISELAKDFISKLLVREPSQRLPPGDCLRHAWLQRGGHQLEASRRSSRRGSLAVTGVDLLSGSGGEESGGDSPLIVSLDKRNLKKYVVRRKWHKTVHAIMALGRMGANLKLRL